MSNNDTNNSNNKTEGFSRREFENYRRGVDQALFNLERGTSKEFNALNTRLDNVEALLASTRSNLKWVLYGVTSVLILVAAQYMIMGLHI